VILEVISISIVVGLKVVTTFIVIGLIFFVVGRINHYFRPDVSLMAWASDDAFFPRPALGWATIIACIAVTAFLVFAVFEWFGI